MLCQNCDVSNEDGSLSDVVVRYITCVKIKTAKQLFESVNLHDGRITTNALNK